MRLRLQMLEAMMAAGSSRATQATQGCRAALQRQISGRCTSQLLCKMHLCARTVKSSGDRAGAADCTFLVHSMFGGEQPSVSGTKHEADNLSHIQGKIIVAAAGVSVCDVCDWRLGT